MDCISSVNFSLRTNGTLLGAFLTGSASDYNVFKSNVISFLDHCVEHDLHLNPDKVRINVDSVQFFGQTLTKKGLMMDENKWKVIQDWPVPTNIKELSPSWEVSTISASSFHICPHIGGLSKIC